MAENAGPDSPSREAALQASYLFRDLPPTQRTELAGRIRWRRYPRGTYIFRVGDSADGIFILVSGAIQGSRTGPDGEEYVDMVISQAGDIVGETAAVIEGELRMMDGLATEDTEGGLLPSADLFALLEADKVVMRRMVVRLAELVRERARFMAGMSFLDTTGRVAAKLLELSATQDPLRTQREQIIRVPQRVLAGMVLASRESVNRALATLSAEGAIKLEAGESLSGTRTFCAGEPATTTSVPDRSELRHTCSVTRLIAGRSDRRRSSQTTPYTVTTRRLL